MNDGKKLVTTVRVAAATALVAALAAGAGPAGAAVESCSYDAGSKVVTASITSGSEATLKVKASGELWFGLAPAACGGATTTNTDLITVAGNPGTTEKLTVDMTEGFIGPGFSSESNLPEIEFEVNLGDTADTFAVIGTPGDDRMASGLSGYSFNQDGDLDVVFSPLPATMSVVGGGGSDFLTARGGWGAGLAYPGNFTATGGAQADELNGGNGSDTISGGGGNDVINGYGANDTLDGGAGDDRVSGGDGNDTLTGGPGADELIAGYGNDTLFANDGETDVQIHGGPDTDTATVDANIDPGTIAVENKIVDSGPPPPPPPPGGACTYNAATKSVTAGLPAGGTATLAVVGTEIRFGETPVACDGATTLNTDTITVNGAAGSVEHLVVDQSGGALAPGAGSEGTGIAEIEVRLNLGDAGDEIVLHGTPGNDSLAMGTKGLSFTGDTDVDVTFGTVPNAIEIVGGEGDDVLTGRGGFGSGQVYAGRVVLRGDGGADTLTGGNLADLLVGGDGNDTITGYGGDDEIFGEGGADSMSGNGGNDLLVGGAGADSFVGGTGNDTFEAADDEADTILSGGAGVDMARYDAGLDPAPSAVENHLPE